MVDKLLIILKEYTFKISLYLFLIVSIIFILSVVVYYIERLIVKLKSIKEKKYYDFVYDFMLGKIPLDELRSKKLNKSILTDVFAKTISLLTGEKQIKLKNAVKKLELIETIVKGLHNILPSKRTKACYLSGLLGLKEHYKLLIPVLHDLNPRVVSSSIIALGELRYQETVPDILSIFPFCSEAQSWLISAILPFFGPGIYQHIKPYLKLNMLPENKLILLIKVISNLQITESIRDLEYIFTNTNNLDIKINALNAIGKINDVISIKVVFNALNNEYWQMRAVAANIVGNMALKGASSRLVPLLNDKNWYVRKNAANALAKMGKLGIYTLLNYMSQNDKYARDMIAQTLEETGAVDRAIKNIKNDNPNIKKDAEYILKMLIQHGYTKYLENFSDEEPFIKEILSTKETAGT